jgi:hypothetical protein
MKQIEPVSIWYNGQIVQAIIFNLTSINDNLVNNATFYWQLFDANDLQISQGNLNMGNPDYTNYSSSADSNEYAYQWGATQLNLTLV